MVRGSYCIGAGAILSLRDLQQMAALRLATAVTMAATASAAPLPRQPAASEPALTGEGNLSSSIAAGFAPTPACAGALLAYCGAAEGQVEACGSCAEKYQHELLVATCRAADVDSFCAGRPIVAVPGVGSMVGSAGYGVANFFGIPYVAPPVGPLRWRPPVAHAPWAGVRNATAPGDVCIQGDAKPGTAMSEDCLFMNIATPITALSSPAKLPVMVCESPQRAPLYLRSRLTCAAQGSTAAGTRRARAASTATLASFSPLRCASSWSRSTTA